MCLYLKYVYIQKKGVFPYETLAFTESRKIIVTYSGNHRENVRAEENLYLQKIYF